MKWLVFIPAVLGAAFLAGWLRRNPSELPKALMAVGALPYFMNSFGRAQISLYGWPDWTEFSKGIEISIIDLVIVAIYFSLPRTKNSLPFKFSIAFYFATVVLSTFQAQVPVASSFFISQLLRTIFVYAVVARACVEERCSSGLLYGMALGLCFEGCIVFWQRFVIHQVQVVGSFPHQNSLGLVTHFFIFPFFALLLAGEKGWLVKIVPAIGAITQILTASRGSFGLAGVGFVLLSVLSMKRKLTSHKLRILAAAGVVAVLLAPLAFRAFELRFIVYGTESVEYDERKSLESVASMMLSDYPMGVGANNFIVVANTQGYMARASVASLSQGTLVHNVYWAVAAETGYIGILAFAIFLLRPLTVAFLCGWRSRGDIRGDLLLGCATSLIVVYAQSLYEWIFLSDVIQYVFAIVMGLIAGVASQLGYWKKPVVRYGAVSLMKGRDQASAV